MNLKAQFDSGTSSASRTYDFIQQQIKEHKAPARWLYTDSEAEQVDSIGDRFDPDTRRWLSESLALVRAGSLDRATLYAQVHDKFQEGLIPFKVMSHVSKSLGGEDFLDAQFLEQRGKRPRGDRAESFNAREARRSQRRARKQEQKQRKSDKLRLDPMAANALRVRREAAAQARRDSARSRAGSKSQRPQGDQARYGPVDVGRGDVGKEDPLRPLER
jgi:hypothetical protein